MQDGVNLKLAKRSLQDGLIADVATNDFYALDIPGAH